MSARSNSAASSSRQAAIDKASIAEAVARRQESTIEAHREVEDEKERDLRQNFRRLIDPGIVRPNSKETVITSLNTLSTIAKNLLNDPDNPKFQRFKPTNTIIKNNLVEVPGALEYAVAMGFRAEVENFQPYYVHSKRHMKELRIGTFIIAEAVERENAKVERALQNAAHEKEARKGVTEKVKMNYLDDRKEKKLRDEMERQRREALLEKARLRAEAEAASGSAPIETEEHGGQGAINEPGSGTNEEGQDDYSEDASGSDADSNSESKR